MKNFFINIAWLAALAAVAAGFWKILSIIPPVIILYALGVLVLFIFYTIIDSWRNDLS